MKIKKSYLYIGAAIAALLLYKRSTAAAAKPSVVVLPQPSAGALGAYTTRNSMLEELGSLGCSK